MNPSKLLRPAASFITSLNIRAVYNIRTIYNIHAVYNMGSISGAAKSEALVSQEGEKAPTTSRQGEKQAEPQEEEEEKPHKAKVRKVGETGDFGLTDLRVCYIGV